MNSGSLTLVTCDSSQVTSNSEHIPSSVKEENLLRRAIFLNVVMCVQDFSQNV